MFTEHPSIDHYATGSSVGGHFTCISSISHEKQNNLSPYGCIINLIFINNTIIVYRPATELSVVSTLSASEIYTELKI